VPDQSEFAWGLPGTLDPVPFFDPAGFATDASLEDIKMYREAEVTHGRVSMLAVLGFLVQEEAHFLFVEPDKDIGPAIRHLDEVRAVNPVFFEGLAFVIACAELYRSLYGWANPSVAVRQLNDDYYPGDVGFDPLGLKPEDPTEFAEMATKELQQGRLAMLAIAGFFAQELTNGQTILATATGLSA
jgi:light-harvesting complex I chlorophyll a/b binding protein 1